MQRGFKSWSDLQAEFFRKELGLKPFDPLCAFDLAEFLSVPVIPVTEVEGLSMEQLQLLNSSNHWSAVTIKIEGESDLIVHNGSHSEARQQSDIMHELAHIICNHQPTVTSQEYFHLALRDYDKAQEEEANWFGPSLKLPRKALAWAKGKKMTESAMAKHFNASLDMVNYRVRITGINRQFR